MDWTNSYSLKTMGSFASKTRKAKGYTQQEFAELIGISHATLSAFETGKNVSTKVMEKTLNYLGLRLIIVPKNARVLVELPQDKEGGNEQ